MQSRLWLKVIVRDSAGKVTYRKRCLSHSFVKQWNQLVYCHMSNDTPTIKDTGGVNRVLTRHANDFNMTAAAATATYGIVVGVGNNAVTLSDFQLQTIVTEGVGLNQMNYAITTVTTSAVAPPLCGFTVARAAVNNSALGVTVTEAAIYVVMGAASWFACAVRDVFAGILIPVGGAITINYTLQVTA